MKKRWIAACVLLALLALAAAGVWQHMRGAAPLTTGDTGMRFDAGGDFVSAYGQLDEDGLLEIEQTFYLKNRTGAEMEDIVLRQYANAAYDTQVQACGASVNGDAYEVLCDDEDATLYRIARAWAADEEIELTLSTTIRIADGAQPAVVSLPVPAALQDGQWRTDAWDVLAGKTHTQAMDGYLHLLYPQTLTAAFAGEAGHLGMPAGSQEGVLSAVMHLDGARGMTFAVSGEGCVRWRELGGVAVSAMAGDARRANRLLDCAQTALASLGAIGLDYPFASLCIVESTPISADGDVYSAMIVLDGEEDTEALLRRMTRLIAGQTFGVYVGCDPWSDPFLSVSLASAAELLAFRERKGEAAFEERFYEEIEVSTRLTRPYGVNVGAGILAFGSDTEMTQVLRDRGAAMLLGIGQAEGYDVLMQAMNAYAQGNARGIADRTDFFAALERVTGSDWSGYLMDEMSR